MRTAGIVLMRQRPHRQRRDLPTLEDESGQVTSSSGSVSGASSGGRCCEARLLEVHGELQQQDGVTHLIAHRLSTGILRERKYSSKPFSMSVMPRKSTA